MNEEAAMDGFEQFSYKLAEGGEERSVFHLGHGPGVLLMHELPGMSEQCVRLARQIAAQGYTVFLPLFFGTPGHGSMLNTRFCIRGEFSYWSRQMDSPLLQWLRGLSREIHRRCGGKGIGAIGMCLTGGFALGLLVEPAMMAPVVSQPARPGFSFCRWRDQIDLSEEQWQASRERAIRDEVPVLGLRFSHDMISPADRFSRLAKDLGSNFRPFVIDSSCGNPHSLSVFSHSVLTEGYRDEPGHPTQAALDEVLQFLSRQLRDRATQ